MPDYTELFTHPSDRAAMAALKAIPGFSQVAKAYMSILNERQFRIMNMSGNLRLSEKQLPDIYRMLPPICRKLNIDVPELYVELDPVPNAYTYGDTRPFIVLTSGMLETMPTELISTVLAHECGHIACHHTLYTTMARMILSGTMKLPGLASLITLPLQTALAYWMRCSEFSADRAAVVYEGTDRKMIDVCMRLAGCGKNFSEGANVDAFLEQALEYREMVKDSTWDKGLEVMVLINRTHPFTAVRALECREWVQTGDYKRIELYLDEITPSGSTGHSAVPVPDSAKNYVGRDCGKVAEEFFRAGFANVELIPSNEPPAGIGSALFGAKPDAVTSVTINGYGGFSAGDWYPADACVMIYFYSDIGSKAPAIDIAGGISKVLGLFDKK